MSHDALRSNDTRFLAVAAQLSDAQWAAPSLCAEWTNHDVLAHLVFGYQSSPVAFATEITRVRGSFDAANNVLTQRLSAVRSPTDLVDDYARLIHRPRGLGRVFPRRLLLGDHVIHELDILLALDCESTIDVRVVSAVLDTQVQVPNPFIPARARARGLRLFADDLDWTHGDGPLVSGPGPALASVLAGRPHALPMLTGDGVDILRTRIS